MITGFIRFLSRGAAARVSAIALVGAIGLGTRNAAAQQPTPAVAAPVLSPSEAERKLKRDARDAGLLAPRRALEALPLVRPSDEEELPSSLRGRAPIRLQGGTPAPDQADVRNSAPRDTVGLAGLS